MADAGDWVFAASKFGLFQHHKTEGDVVRLSKVNGLSDIGYSAIAWSDDNNTLVVAYTNTNIDLIKDGQVINIPDIKDKSILGNKVINNIDIKGDYAYLACGFAIVVLDIVKEEIKDTYYMGPNGSVINVYDVVTSDNQIFACTESGVYRAQLTGTNLANFENWTPMSGIPAGTYSAGTWFNNQLYVSLSIDNVNDSIYYYQNQQWTNFGLVDEQEVKALESGNDVLLVVTGGSVSEFNTNHERLRLAYDYGGGTFGRPNHAWTDENGIMWIADSQSGLVRHPQNLSFSTIRLNGPAAVSNTDISIWDGRCYVSSGSISEVWSNAFNKNGLYTYKNGQWGNINAYTFPETSTFQDYMRVIVDPFDSKRVYTSSYGKGVVEYYDDQFVAFYDTSNSTLEDLPGSNGNIRVTGLQIDRITQTLWVAGSGTNNLLFAKDRQGVWYAFKIAGVGSITLSDIAIDDSGQKWVVAPRGVGVGST